MIYHELGTHNQKGQRSTYLQIRTKSTLHSLIFVKFYKQSGDYLPNKGCIGFQTLHKATKPLAAARFNLQIHQFHISFLLTKETVVKLLGWFWETAKFSNKSVKGFWLDSKQRVSGFSYHQRGYKLWALYEPLKPIIPETSFLKSIVFDDWSLLRFSLDVLPIGDAKKWGKETNWLNF